ncbi:MAG: ribosome rescue protein RqcH, partial [Methanosarcinales archaeon]
MKTEMTSVDVAFLVKELQNKLIDAKIGKIYQLTPDEIRFSLYAKEIGRVNLIIEAGKRLHLTKEPRPSPRVPLPFAVLLRNHLMGGRIKRIEQYDFDRIIEIQIKRGDTETILVVELFSKGNIVLLEGEKNRKIILPFRSVSSRDLNPFQRKGSKSFGRRVKRGEIYEFPEEQLNPMTVTKVDLQRLFANSNKDLVRTLATNFNIGGLFAEEICIMAAINKNTQSKDLTETQIEKVYKAILKIFEPLHSLELKPHIVIKESENIDVQPFELLQYKDFEKKYFGTFNEALDEYFSKKITKEKEIEIEEIHAEKVNIFERRLAKQEEKLNKFRKEEIDNIKKGEAIYTEYNKVEEILNTIKSARDSGYSWQEIDNIIQEKKAKTKNELAKRIISIDPSSGVIVVELKGLKIPLDLKLTIPQNANKFYELAKTYAKKREGAEKAIEETKKIIESNKESEAEVSKPSKKPKIKKKKHWYDRFRWFISSDGFLVVGGRDADTNEDIFKKYMEKKDIVFHADVKGAPLVIIKTHGKEVPNTTLEETAQFAISYSKVWKSGHYSGDCYWVTPEQVSKTPEHGEYIVRGSFIIRGKRNYFKNTQVGIAIGIEEKECRVIGGPVSAIKKHSKYAIEIEPGEF